METSLATIFSGASGYWVTWLGMHFVLLLVFLALTYRSGGERKETAATADFKKFRNNYVAIYLCMMLADWLQGPYVYALYKKYGYSVSEIGTLFLIGFGTSMALGPFIGGFSDVYGRKMLCLVFAALYSLSCVTKHFSSFGVLAVGRVLGGACTSILMSCFEAWLVAEHRSRGFADDSLGQIMAVASQGNGVVAILAGIFGQAANDALGPVGPFDLSMFFLLCGGAAIALTWPENRGDAGGPVGSGSQQGANAESGGAARVGQAMAHAFATLKADPVMVMVGSVQSLFEGPMYIFVFMWTLALEVSAEAVLPVSHGIVFACFMVACFIGSGLFSVLLERKASVEHVMQYLLAVAGLSLLAVALSERQALRMFAFCVFEICCGVFWPTAGTLRAKYVPEDVRSTISNIFRVPLNLIVLFSLTFLIGKSQQTVFLFAAALLFVAVGCQRALIMMVERKAAVVTKPGSAAYAPVKQAQQPGAAADESEW